MFLLFPQNKSANMKEFTMLFMNVAFEQDSGDHLNIKMLAYQ